MKNYAKIILAVAAVAAPMQALAVTGDVQFNGTVSNTCAITVGSAGSLTTNVGQTILGSEQAGGAAGTATIVATSAAYQVSTDAPIAFTTAPGGGGANVTYASNYATTGATTIAQTSSANALAAGTTNVSVNMAATKTVGSFPSGNYVTTVTLRCE